ncbi:transformation system protein [Campylobacter sp. LH-2024]|uniref:Transformation system protein n=1 Tax=Campylobacter molothri TaxID=1032242 RepID=A0ACC5W092_9BACT|nr:MULTISPECIES: transformation system protein [unclassified Campylobacter]MBZ7928610.1 transformation system protein [Campylobacter sp. RM10542]MBZ7931933.1 transformation system protein [Campylobacter sp. RM12910]MBZ7932434.1 transformation system protein [Campylobacter sp. RM10543]MBZ7934879.1 transformation system protein [Campylobacter sp. W0065]MBZ7936731.1 transformation system protein [Campylobacter sp. RM10538]MBZ7941177.1 transformation system protein [Campylobacter sp. W0047]MBZ79
MAQDDFEEYFRSLNSKCNIDLENLQNPFLNPTFEKIKKLNIAAIMLNQVKINNHWYKKGDIIDGALIVEINKKDIVLQYDALNFKINFKTNDKINIY